MQNCASNICLGSSIIQFIHKYIGANAILVDRGAQRDSLQTCLIISGYLPGRIVFFLISMYTHMCNILIVFFLISMYTHSIEMIIVLFNARMTSMMQEWLRSFEGGYHCSQVHRGPPYSCDNASQVSPCCEIDEPFSL